MRPRLHSNGKALSIAINLLVGPYAPGRNVILLPDPPTIGETALLGASGRVLGHS